MYKKGDPERPENYRPIVVTNSIYRVIMKLYRVRLQRLVDHIASPEQYGSQSQHTASEHAANLVNTLHDEEKEGQGAYVVLLDVAKAFPSTLHAAILEILMHARYPDNYVAAIKRVYQHTDTYCDIKGQRIHYKPTRGVKEVCPCSPPLFSVVYELLLKQLMIKYLNAFVYVNDIAIVVKSQHELERLFADMSVWISDWDPFQSGKD